MADNTRTDLAMTQQMMARWLGIPRSTLALTELGRQSLPRGTGMKEARLLLAALGLVPHPTGATPPIPAPPSLPLPDPDIMPLEDRLRYCRYHASRLTYELTALRRKAAGYEARYKVVPALRAWTGPMKDPEREANWITSFQQEADYELRHVCGAGPQRLLEARIAGLEREAELLAAALPEASPAP